MQKLRIGVIGDGGWGTTLAILLARKKYRVTLWGAFAEYTAQLRKTRRNERFLPGIAISRDIAITSDLDAAVCGRDIVVLAVPSEHMREVVRKIKALDIPVPAQAAMRQPVFVSVSKGIEAGSLKRNSEIIRDELGGVRCAVLSGPTIAREVVSGIPTVAVAAAHDEKIRLFIQQVFTTKTFRVYTNDDIAGVELGGSLKNVIAIACGISDGLGFGSNTKAALLSRGLAEMSRLGTACGAKPGTFSGISGLGDLVTTCISPYSRNRTVGEQIGKGRTWRRIKRTIRMAVEGVPTAQAAYEMSRKCRVPMPISHEVYKVLYKNKSPVKALNDLMSRASRAE